MRIERSCDYTFKAGLDIIFSSSLNLNLDDLLLLQFLFCLSRTQVRSFGRLVNICWNLSNPLCGPRHVCDYFLLNLSQCYLCFFFLLQIEPSMMKIESQLKIIVSFIIKGGRVELKQFTNWWTVFTSLWKKTFSLYGEIFIHRNNSIHCKVKKLTSSPHGENNYDEWFKNYPFTSKWKS